MGIEEQRLGARVQNGEVVLAAVISATVAVVGDVAPVLAEAVL